MAHDAGLLAIERTAKEEPSAPRHELGARLGDAEAADGREGAAVVVGDEEVLLLRAAKKGRGNYTPRFFFKFYRVVAKVLPRSLVMKMAKT